MINIDAKSSFIKVNGSYKKPKKIFVKVNGVWRSVKKMFMKNTNWIEVPLSTGVNRYILARDNIQKNLEVLDSNFNKVFSLTNGWGESESRVWFDDNGNMYRFYQQGSIVCTKINKSYQIEKTVSLNESYVMGTRMCCVSKNRILIILAGRVAVYDTDLNKIKDVPLNGDEFNWSNNYSAYSVYNVFSDGSILIGYSNNVLVMDGDSFRLRARTGGQLFYQFPFTDKEDSICYMLLGLNGYRNTMFQRFDKKLNNINWKNVENYNTGIKACGYKNLTYSICNSGGRVSIDIFDSSNFNKIETIGTGLTIGKLFFCDIRNGCIFMCCDTTIQSYYIEERKLSPVKSIDPIGEPNYSQNTNVYINGLPRYL